jgi:hypothetical protein
MVRICIRQQVKRDTKYFSDWFFVHRALAHTAAAALDTELKPPLLALYGLLSMNFVKAIHIAHRP